MLCLSLMLCAGYFYYMVQSSIPDEISVYEGQEEQLDEIFPSTFVTYDDSLEVFGKRFISDHLPVIRSRAG